jgi:hypothetical protein
LKQRRGGAVTEPQSARIQVLTMHRPLRWITTAVLGAAAAVMTSFGLLAALLFLVLAIPLVVRGAHLVALSGLLTGFGGFWTFLMARESSSGGTLDNSTSCLAVGIVPLATGLALLVLVGWRERSGRPVAHG